MANIHRIGDYQNNNPGRRAPLLGGRQANAIPFISTVRQEGDPRKESPFDMLKLTCCPSLRLLTFTVIITLIDVAIFITTLVYSGIKYPNWHQWQKANEVQFLSPYYGTLDTFGSRIPMDIYLHYQVYRFITPVFLHANFLHIFWNTVSQLILGSQIELILGTKRMIIVYFICGVGGNLFGGLLSTASAVGASTAIVGLLGVYIAFVIVNWKRIDPQIKCFMICIISFVVIFNVLFSVGGSGNTGKTSQSEVDQWGHLGGLITGITAGMFLVAPIGGAAGSYESKVKKIGIGLTAFYFVLGFCLFFLVVKPTTY